MDMKFIKIVPEIPNVVINTSAERQHMAEVVFWLNMMPTKSDYTNKFSLRELIYRQQPDQNDGVN